MATTSTRQDRSSVGTSLAAVLRLTRGTMCVLIGGATWVAWSIAPSGNGFHRSAMATSLAMALFAGAGFALNDVLDVSKDAVNRPSAPLVRQDLRTGTALLVACLLAIAALALAVTAGPRFVMLSVLILAALAAYSPILRRYGYLANATTAALCAVPMLVPWIADGAAPSFASLAIAVLAYLFISGRELVKDIVDLPGDALVGVRSVPVVHGECSARRIALGFFAACAVLSAVLPLLRPHLATVLLTCAALSLAALVMVLSRRDRVFLGVSQVLLAAAILVAGFTT